MELCGFVGLNGRTVRRGSDLAVLDLVVGRHLFKLWFVRAETEIVCDLGTSQIGKWLDIVDTACDNA